MLPSLSLLAQVDAAGAQLRNFLRLFETSTGFVALGIVIVLAVAVAFSKGMKWYVLGAMFFASTLSVVGNEYFKPVLAFPFEQMRQQGRGITLGLLMGLLLPGLIAARGWRVRLLASVTVAYFTFEIVFCLRLGIGGQYERAIFGLMVFLMTFGVMASGLSRWLQDVTDAHRLLRGITFGAGLLVAVTAVLLLRDRSQVVHAGRLLGATGNPQHLAVACALFLGPTTYLVIQRTEAVVWRLFAGAVGALLVIFLIWTGSRTGALMAVVQFLMLFRLRVGRVILGAMVFGLFLLLDLLFFSEGFDSASRLVSTENTRQATWQRLVEDFVRNPLLGVMGEELGGGESSYLSAASQLGLLGVIPLAIVGVFGVTQWRRLHRVRPHLGDYVLLADLVTAGLVTLCVGALFEGYLMATISVAVFFLYAYFALLAFLIDLGAATGASAADDAAANAHPSYEAELAYEAGR